MFLKSNPVQVETDELKNVEICVCKAEVLFQDYKD